MTITIVDSRKKVMSFPDISAVKPCVTEIETFPFK